MLTKKWWNMDTNDRFLEWKSPIEFLPAYRFQPDQIQFAILLKLLDKDFPDSQFDKSKVLRFEMRKCQRIKLFNWKIKKVVYIFRENDSTYIYGKQAVKYSLQLIRRW